jgi:hypothetical protein
MTTTAPSSGPTAEHACHPLLGRHPVRSLLQYDQFFGPKFTIEYPTGSGEYLALRDIAGLDDFTSTLDMTTIAAGPAG